MVIVVFGGGEIKLLPKTKERNTPEDGFIGHEISYCSTTCSSIVVLIYSYYRKHTRSWPSRRPFNAIVGTAKYMLMVFAEEESRRVSIGNFFRYKG